MLKLYNSLTSKVEEFKPIKKGEASLYTCGPTVYDHVHIGNLRTYIFEDTLRRVLKLGGQKINHTMNLTDIDDKTIKRSQEQYPNEDPKEALRKLTRHYEKLFLKDAQLLGIDFSETKIARATEHIDDMHTLITQIPNKYVADDGVYFDISQDQDYGVLVKLDRSHEHHRINNDNYDKEHVADFALWKAQKAGEPAWDFDVDGKNIAGHPGWHIECSAMSTKYLGQPFDIHTGGVDLKFPHHENEIAQSRAAAKKPLAKYWVHGEHLVVDGKKMSKSLKNFYTLEDIVKKGFDPLAFRLLILQSHYRSQLNFTWESLQAAQNHLHKIRAWADLRWQNITRVTDQNQKKVLESIKQALQNNLDTPKAIAELSAQSDVAAAPSAQILEELDNLLSLGLAQTVDIDKEQKKILTDRESARKSNDFAKSDKLRNGLSKQGIGIRDSEHGPIWFRL